MNEKIQSVLNSLPHKPGIYIMKDGQGTILYVGKAISLYNRVRSYFQESTDLSPKNRSMVAKVEDIEFLVVKNEVEALVLGALGIILSFLLSAGNANVLYLLAIMALIPLTSAFLSASIAHMKSGGAAVFLFNILATLFALTGGGDMGGAIIVGAVGGLSGAFIAGGVGGVIGIFVGIVVGIVATLIIEGLHGKAKSGALSAMMELQILAVIMCILFFLGAPKPVLFLATIVQIISLYIATYAGWMWKTYYDPA